MPETVISVLLFIMAAYLIAGIFFTIPFQVMGLKKIDEGVHGSSIGFRIIIVPGCILLWPFLLRKWIKATDGKEAGLRPKQ
jgi:hypothetical protein